jgi:transcriptional regulator with XRE-family HTH domain
MSAELDRVRRIANETAERREQLVLAMREACEKHSLAEVAEAAGVSVSYVSRLVRGERGPFRPPRDTDDRE